MAGNTQETRGQWHTVRSQAKGRWEQLPDNDLSVQDDNLEQLVDHIQKKTGERREAIADALSDKPAQDRSAVSHAVEAVDHFAHEAGQRARARYDRTEDVVRHNPARSVLAIFGIGLVAGLVVGLALRHR